MKLLFYIFLFLPVLGLAQSFEGLNESQIEMSHDGFFSSRSSTEYNLYSENYIAEGLNDGYHVIMYDGYRKKMEGHIKNGKMQGQWILYSPNCQNFILAEYDSGIQNGIYEKYTVYFNDTMLVFRGKFKNGIPVGNFHGFKWDGELYLQWHFSDGIISDTTISYTEYYNSDSTSLLPKHWQFYDSLGHETKEIYFEYDSSGNLIEEFVYDEQPYKREVYIDSSRQKHTDYWDNGNWREVGTYYMNKRDGLFIFYYKNGNMQAEISYKNGEVFGTSRYYDTEENLIRISYIDSLMSYDIFKGDTVNLTDSLGLKQGKWVDIVQRPWFFNYNESKNIFQNTEYSIQNTKYYCNNRPCGTWQINNSWKFSYYYSYRSTLSDTYEWQKDSYAKLSMMYDNTIVETGNISENILEFGHWQFFNSENGKLTFEGDYFYGRKVGIWNVYNKREKIEAEVNFDKCKNIDEYNDLHKLYKFPRWSNEF